MKKGKKPTTAAAPYRAAPAAFVGGGAGCQPKPGVSPDAMKRLHDHISSQASEPWKRLKAGLPEGVEVKTELQPTRLCLKYTFYHKDMGEAGHVRAIFAGDRMSLNGLHCGIRSDGDAFTGDRRILMLGIYETAKAAFGEG